LALKQRIGPDYEIGNIFQINFSILIALLFFRCQFEKASHQNIESANTKIIPYYFEGDIESIEKSIFSNPLFKNLVKKK